uniref:Succinate dehydrogenase assembly factor 4, mitochondrial n=1 Tax=Panagrellus redivivus TaxID=6233 RepID=A0A7E4UXD2_PANRE
MYSNFCDINKLLAKSDQGGNEEWKCENAEPKKPPVACCTPLISEKQPTGDNATTCSDYLSKPKPYGTSPTSTSPKRSWWQAAKDFCWAGWNKVPSVRSWWNSSSAASRAPGSGTQLNSYYSSTSQQPSRLVRWGKAVLNAVWQGVCWIGSIAWSVLAWFLGTLRLIFFGREATADDAQQPPSSYVYRRIESPRDYAYQQEQKEEESDAVVEDAGDNENGEEEQTNANGFKFNVEPPQPTESVLSNGDLTEDAQIKQASTQDVNAEAPMSFYVRRVSLTSTQNRHASPIPVPPPPPTGIIKIPTSEQPKIDESKRNAPVDSPKGGVFVLVPGLMDAAKESAERRQRGRTVSPVRSEGPQPFKQPNNIPVVTRIEPHTPTNPSSVQQFVFRPRSQMTRTVQNESPSPWTVPDRQASASPTPSAFLLGNSVFKPMTEIEKMRDNFNRRCESRATSVVGTRPYSRSPSVMSQSYHDGAVRESDNYSSSLRDHTTDNVNYRSQGLRNRFAPSMERQGPRPYSGFGQPAETSQAWTLRNNDTDPVFRRLPPGATRKVLEQKVTERHLEKDIDGQVLNGWRQQNWLGSYEEFQGPPSTRF